MLGTNEVLRLAFEGRPKSVDYISTTFIFGWAVKKVLYETDANRDMELLDFGYSQSKWVAERVVEDAGRRGLTTRIFRPALVSPSITGGGNNFDIAVRLVAFMVNHGIGVDALNQVSFVPADVMANNTAIATSLARLTRPIMWFETIGEHAGYYGADYKGHGATVEIFSIRDFVPELIRRCRSKEDLLFPLVGLPGGFSGHNISDGIPARYDSSCYQAARDSYK